MSNQKGKVSAYVASSANTLPTTKNGTKPQAGAVLELQDLFRIYREQDIETVALRGVSLTVQAGEFVAIVGRSGSGKSTLLSMAAGLTTPSAGKVLVEGQDIAHIGEEARAVLRRRKLGIVFQSNNLIPFLTARENVELAIEPDNGTTTKLSHTQVRERATKLLEQVGLAKRLNHRPAQLSGGEQQRVAIAVALANDPAILLADELTGELDSVTAGEIIQLLAQLNRERGTAIVLVTHNLELAVQAGRSVKIADGLLLPFDPAQEQTEIETEKQLAGRTITDFGVITELGVEVLTAKDLTKTYVGGVQALSEVNLAVRAGESLAIMGPSGCGKSTLLNLLGGLDRPTAGSVNIEGRSLSGLDNNALAVVRRREIGFIFQAHNLIGTLSAVENVALPLILDNVPLGEWQSRAKDLLEQVGLTGLEDKLPDQMSGGQRQRVAIARSLAHQPKLLLADEPTGSLDSETAAQVAALLTGLAHTQQIALVMVTHDALVAARCDRVLHLADGRVVNSSGTGDVTSQFATATLASNPRSSLPQSGENLQ